MFSNKSIRTNVKGIEYRIVEDESDQVVFLNNQGEDIVIKCRLLDLSIDKSAMIAEYSSNKGKYSNEMSRIREILTQMGNIKLDVTNQMQELNPSELVWLGYNDQADSIFDFDFIEPTLRIFHAFIGQLNYNIKKSSITYEGLEVNYGSETIYHMNNLFDIISDDEFEDIGIDYEFYLASDESAKKTIDYVIKFIYTCYDCLLARVNEMINSNDGVRFRKTKSSNPRGLVFCCQEEH